MIRSIFLPAVLAASLIAGATSARAQGFVSVSSAPVVPATSTPPVVQPAVPDNVAAAPVETPAPGSAQAVATTVPFGSSGSVAAPVSGFQTADRVLVKKAERRLYLLRANQTIAEYPIRLGLNPNGNKQREGDFRTPEGTYHLVRRNPRSDFFLSLEVSYPNDEDRARARKTGVRPGGLIMIHGQPNVMRKSPEYYSSFDWTNGCIAVRNSDMVDIWLRTGVGTPIEIRP